MKSEILLVSDLQELLDPDNIYKWLAFMDKIHTKLPLILRQGKPRKTDIEQSIIGQSGFSSWREMLEAPKPNGFGWRYATFDAWKRAYNLVLTHSYLRELELTASQINTIYRESKPNFPKNLNDFNSFSESRKEKQVEQQQNSLKAAQNRVLELEKGFNEEKIGLQTLLDDRTKEVHKLKHDLDDRIKEIHKLKHDLDDRVSEITVFKTELLEIPHLSEKLKKRSSEIKLLNKTIVELTKKNKMLVRNAPPTGFFNRLKWIFK